jgi:outer membrane lipoprotein-sorting protein
MRSGRRESEGVCYDRFLQATVRIERILLTSGRITVATVLWILIGVAVLSPVSDAQNHAPTTREDVLKQLDAASGGFHGLSADVERTKVTVVVNDRSTDTGTILVKGNKMLLEMKPPDARTILKTSDSLYVFTPGLKRVEQYNLGKNRALVDEFLLLGFGTPGSQLEQGYQVTFVEESPIDGKKTAELELIPKEGAVKNQFSKIQIWFDETTWLPIQQQLYETGSGDYSIVHYSNIVKNPPAQDSQFKPHWPKGTQVEKPQG